MQATIGVWSPTVLGVKHHNVPASPLVNIIRQLFKESLENRFMHPSKKAHPLFSKEVVAKGALKSSPTYLFLSSCCYVKQEASKKQHCARGETNK